MATKRTRATFEEDLRKEQSPYVIFGTALPPLDPEVRDDGSYVPVWKQEVTDEQGRKRLHGAFTGGFSAGYFNTVGSKDGWTPSTFVSSRTNRRKDAGTQQKAEDFMDEEDMAAAEDDKIIATNASYSGLGSTDKDISQGHTIMDLFRAAGETVGTKLLRRMGWRDGQGIGPRVRRKARLDDVDNQNGDGEGVEAHLFAPDNSEMISFQQKNDRKGLGFQGENKLDDPFIGSSTRTENSGEDGSLSSNSRKLIKKPPKKGGIGVGTLNDTGSDDDDPYEMGPQISYNKAIGSVKHKKKKPGKSSIGSSNPLLRSKPVFFSKKTNTGRLSASLRKCHDGRLPLDGFTLSIVNDSTQRPSAYPPPKVPPDWTSSRTPTNCQTPYQTTAILAKSSTHDPSSRAALLGETKLIGKSVFDYITPNTRDRIVGLTKNAALPAAGSEAPASTPLASFVPSLDPTVAATALGRGTSGFMPYTDNPSKLARYRAFLSFSANISPTAPAPEPGTSRDDWRKELDEFAHAATIFKPMTGMMASRFTSASTVAGSFSVTKPNSSGTEVDCEDNTKLLLSQPASKRTDPAEEAAAIGMFGPLTRSSAPFFPSRLLCKRFNVPVPNPPPASASQSAPADTMSSAAVVSASAERSIPDFSSRFRAGGIHPGSNGEKVVKELLGKEEMETLRREAGVPEMNEREEVDKKATVNLERNEALEKDRPGDAVFKAIFGSDSEDE